MIPKTHDTIVQSRASELCTQWEFGCFHLPIRLSHKNQSIADPLTGEFGSSYFFTSGGLLGSLLSFLSPRPYPGPSEPALPRPPLPLPLGAPSCRGPPLPEGDSGCAPPRPVEAGGVVTFLGATSLLGVGWLFSSTMSDSEGQQYRRCKVNLNIWTAPPWSRTPYRNSVLQWTTLRPYNPTNLSERLQLPGSGFSKTD